MFFNTQLQTSYHFYKNNLIIKLIVHKTNVKCFHYFLYRDAKDFMCSLQFCENLASFS